MKSQRPVFRRYFIVQLHSGSNEPAALRQDGTFHFNLEKVENRGGQKGSLEVSHPVPFSFSEPSHFRCRNFLLARKRADEVRATGKYHGKIDVAEYEALYIPQPKLV